jgi:hypothetical protein
MGQHDRDGRMTAAPTLSLRALNRALLARQGLLERRAPARLADALAPLVALQGEVVKPPYLALWARSAAFERPMLARALIAGEAVRGTFVRATLHVLAAEDYPQFRASVQPALDRALKAFYGKKAAGLDVERLCAAAEPFLREAPRTLRDLRAFLAVHEPARDPETMAYAVRTRLPLVQAPPAGVWGVGGAPRYALAEAVLGRPLAPADDAALRVLVRRYLAAFGPASPRDMTAWSGITNLAPHFAAQAAELRAFTGPGGETVYDLPDAPRPPDDAPAPVCFLAEFDSVLLGHAEKTRVLAEADRKSVFLSAGRVAAVFLIDGFAAGTWRFDAAAEGGIAWVSFTGRTLADAERAAVAAEAARLSAWLEQRDAEPDPQA